MDSQSTAYRFVPATPEAHWRCDAQNYKGDAAHYELQIYHKMEVDNVGNMGGRADQEEYIFLGAAYDNLIIKKADFEAHVDTTQSLLSADKALIDATKLPFSAWFEGDYELELWLPVVDAQLHQLRVFSLTNGNPKSRQQVSPEDLYRRNWGAVAGAACTAQRDPNNNFIVGRFFQPAASALYTLVIVLGHWGDGGSDIELKDFLSFVNDAFMSAKCGVGYQVQVGNPPVDTYTCISLHPFGFYSIWVRTEHLDKYIVALGGARGGPDIWNSLHRKEPDAQQVTEVAAALGDQFVASWEDRLGQLVDPTAQTKKRSAPATRGRGGKAPRGRPKKSTAKNATKAQQKSKNGKDYHLPISTLTSFGANKLARSVGARRMKQQKPVMYNVSATEIAQILWAPLLLKPVAAEWLHRSAFSYGGLGSNGHYGSYSAKAYMIQNSQRAVNLVFGTQEANTHMLRVETVIKDVVNCGCIVYPQVSCTVFTTLEPLEDEQAFSFWYSKRMHYYCEVKFGTIRGSKAPKDGFALGTFKYDAPFDRPLSDGPVHVEGDELQHKPFHLFSRYRPFRFEVFLDHGLMSHLFNKLFDTISVVKQNADDESDSDVEEEVQILVGDGPEEDLEEWLTRKDDEDVADSAHFSLFIDADDGSADEQDGNNSDRDEPQNHKGRKLTAGLS